MRKRGRTDSNQNEIVDMFRAMGCSVAVTSALGDGFPDIVVGIRGINFLIEIKDGSKVLSKQKLTDDEKKWHDEWKGSVVVIKNTHEVIRMVNRLNLLTKKKREDKTVDVFA